MGSLQYLEHRIRERLQIAELSGKRAGGQTQAARQVEHRKATLAPAADRLLDRIVRPRMQILARLFDDAILLEPVSSAQRALYVIRQGLRFPAAAMLRIALGADPVLRCIRLTSCLEVFPAVFELENRVEKTFPLDSAHERLVAEYVDQRVEAFVTAHVRLTPLTAAVAGEVPIKEWIPVKVVCDGRTFRFRVEGDAGPPSERPSGQGDDRGNPPMSHHTAITPGGFSSGGGNGIPRHTGGR